MKPLYYIGLGVHKESVAIAYIPAHSRDDATYFASCGGSNLAVERALRKLAKSLGQTIQDLKACYEAGPTGFVLGRKLIALGDGLCVFLPSHNVTDTHGALAKLSTLTSSRYFFVDISTVPNFDHVDDQFIIDDLI